MGMKAYIGDGVYADVEGGMIKLTTENGAETTNTVLLEPEVWTQLVAYVAKAREKGAIDG